MPRRRNCTHPVDTACSWSANPSLSVRCSNRHQVLVQCHLAERPRPRCHRRRHRHPRPRHYSHLAGATELDNLATPLPQMALTLARNGPDAGTKCRARLTPHDTRKARTSRPRRKRGRSPSTDGEGTRTVALTRGLTRTHLPLAEKFMTASGRRVQLDRRSARWLSCFANRRCTTPTRETVASQRIGPWPRTTPICTIGNSSENVPRTRATQYGRSFHLSHA